ncbi:hypothetical protein [Amycolatopsis kentuckyensis]|uniref:hypothetical protein n=1 Tax=Amycolatopsis kentuckyensis TaxID=218823 RepID=UPI000A3A5544|nr:hypothetical protein [Amycolatopsis kentuckyensis]
MTCIVGIKAGDGDIIIGGDSAGVGGLGIETRSDTKVFENGAYLFGYTSSFRMGQLLRFAEMPDVPEGDLYRFMVIDFVDRIRQVFKDGGYARKDNDVEKAGTFLVGVNGRLFKIMDDYQVGEPANDYTAVGCGDDIALGSLHSTANSDLAPEERVFAALEAAEEFSAGVRRPFVIRRLTRQSS